MHIGIADETAEQIEPSNLCQCSLIDQPLSVQPNGGRGPGSTVAHELRVERGHRDEAPATSFAHAVKSLRLEKDTTASTNNLRVSGRSVVRSQAVESYVLRYEQICDAST